jgi:hypothetical protein
MGLEQGEDMTISTIAVDFMRIPEDSGLAAPGAIGMPFHAGLLTRVVSDGRSSEAAPFFLDCTPC